jgi:hypothetical protein
VLYLYGISESGGDLSRIEAEGIDGESTVEIISIDGFLCWVSRVSRLDFAESLTEHMENLEWLAGATVRHQRAVAEILAQVPVLPTRFGTVFLTENSLAAHVEKRSRRWRQALRRVADADEWGIKIFAAERPRSAPAITASSGREYLRRKALTLPKAGKLDSEVVRCIADLEALAVEASRGGKASAGQPMLLWHGSFLVRRRDRKKLESVLSRYASAWGDTRRIDCSGPWPPYSFVTDHE